MFALRYDDPPEAAPPIGQYSQLATVPAGAATTYIAGQLPLDASGGLVAADFAGQASYVFDQLARLAQAAGSSLGQLAYVRTYLVRLDDYEEFKTVRREVFETHGVTSPPPATTLVVAGLVGGSLIEVDAVALGSQA